MSVNKAIFNLLDFKKRAEKILRRLCFMGYSPVIQNNYGCHQVLILTGIRPAKVFPI